MIGLSILMILCLVFKLTYISPFIKTQKEKGEKLYSHNTHKIRKDARYLLFISEANKLSKSSADNLSLNSPFIATLIRPVSSDTTIAIASLL